MPKLNVVQEFPRGPVPIYVKRLDKNERICVTFLGRQFLKVMIHWDPGFKPRGRSEVCTKPASECTGHLRNLPLRGKAYIHIWNQTVKEQQFLELPPQGYLDLCNCWGKPDSFRGIECFLQRGNGIKTRISTEKLVDYGTREKPPLPPELSPWVSLCPLWRMRIEDLDFCNDENFDNLAS